MIFVHQRMFEGILINVSNCIGLFSNCTLKQISGFNALKTFKMVSTLCSSRLLSLQLENAISEMNTKVRFLL